MLNFLALFLAQSVPGGGGTPPPPPPPANRVFHPGLLDPGLHSGRYQRPAQGEFTPDGRLFISYRSKPATPPGPNCNQVNYWAKGLYASIVIPEYLNAAGNGYLESFFDYGPDATGKPKLTEQAIQSFHEAHLIEASPDPCVLTQPPSGYRPRPSGTSSLTVALRPGTNAYEENPFPSNAQGTYKLDGTHRCYDLWLVLAQYDWVFDPTKGTFVEDGPGTLGARDLRVIVDEGVFPPVVSSSTIGAWYPLTIEGGSVAILGQEPSITADGRLIIYNGDGGPNVTHNSNLTYIWNQDACSTAGWKAPASILAMHTREATSMVSVPGANPVPFSERYPLARDEIRDSDGTTYDSAKMLRAPYPWLSKDGAFLVAPRTVASESTTVLTRRGVFALGDITGGYFKHIDETSINPTRAGGKMWWPEQVEVNNAQLLDTDGTNIASTGVKPGTWAPLRGSGAPLPTQVASHRIPVMPVFSPRLSTYGEARFEEADGDYLIYLACNESYRSGLNGINVWNEFDLLRTPDSSGQASRCVATLQGGASFPQEVYGSLALRQSIGTAAMPLHENIGYKGQAILFPPGGSLEVTGRDAYDQQLTVQAFVKVLAGWNQDLDLVVEDDGTAGTFFALRAEDDGSLHGSVTVVTGGNHVTKTVTANEEWLVAQPDPFAPAEGWRHVAMVFDGSSGGDSSLKLYVDGVVQQTVSWTGTSVIPAPQTGTVHVGPRTATSGSSPVLVLDEVAVSRVARTTDELERDAYVTPGAAKFEAMPAEINLPLGLDPEDGKWLAGDVYDQLVVALGHDLFESKILSGDGAAVGPDWGGRSCASCHDPEQDFTDGRTRALSLLGGDLAFNTPTLLNAGFGGEKFFDGRAPTLENQSIDPIISPEELGSTVPVVLARLQDPANLGPGGVSWSSRFQAAFGGQATKARLKKALAMFQRTITTGGSPFDADLAFRNLDPYGSDLLTEAQKRGRALFFGKARCVTCHDGSNLSIDDFRNVRSVDPGEATDGRGGVTGRARELGSMKVPTLRNLENTGPYFHDGRFANLAAVVDHYDSGGPANAKGQRDRQLLPLLLTAGEKSDLVAFLHALTGATTLPTDPSEL